MNPTIMSPSFTENNTRLAAPILTNGKDFVSWQHQLKSWFFENNLWQYVIGYVEQIEEPDYNIVSRTDAKKYFDWQAKNCQAKNMISKCLHPKYRVLIQELTTVEQCWKTLENHFMKDSMISHQQLQDEFDDYKMDYSKSMEDNLMSFSTLISRLKYINIEHSNQKQCHKLLQSLPKSYQNMKTVIKFTSTKENILSISELYERIEDYAREKGHWESPIRRTENVLNVNVKNDNISKNRNNKKFTFKKNIKSFDHNELKKQSLKCTLCQGEHSWFKCQYKEDIVKYGKQLRLKQEINNVEKTSESKDKDDEEDIFVLNTTVCTSNHNSVILDSGCSVIVCNNKNYFNDLSKISAVTLNNFLNESPYNCELGGSASFVFKNEDDESITFTFDNVLYVPTSRYTLLPPSVILDHYGFKTVITKDTVKLIHPKRSSIIGYRENNIYKFPISYNEKVKEVNNILDEGNKIFTANELLKLWHYKLGHLAYSTLKKMAKNKLIPSILQYATAETFCDSCNEGKQTRKPFPKESFNKATYPNQRVIFDLLILNKRCIHNHKYVLGAVDDFSSYDSAYMLSTKDQAADYIKSHIIKMEKLVGQRITICRFDRGGEFMGDNLKEWLKKKGIKIELSVAKSSQQIGKRERMWRTNMDMTRCLLYQSSLPKNLWCCAYQHAIDIRNRVIGSHRNQVAPITKMFKITPNIKGLKVFGCPVSVKDLDSKKLDFKSHDMLFVGFSKESKGFLCYDPLQKTIVIRRDVVFDESFTIHSIETKRLINLKMESLTDDSYNNLDDNEYTDESDDNDNESVLIRKEDKKQFTNVNNDDHSIPNIPNESFNQSPTLSINSNKELNSEQNTKNHSTNININNENTNDNSLRRSERLKYPTRMFMHEVNNVSDKLKMLKASTIPIPKNIKEAFDSEYNSQWKLATDNEINSLIKRNVFEIIEKPNNVYPIRSQWVFCVKGDKDGYVEKFKARLVANGNEQYQSDMFKISSPVLNSTTLILLLTIAKKLQWKIQSIDVKTAYLNAKLDEEVYMYLPAGYYHTERKQNKIALLKRSLYGLKQSAKLWNIELSNTLKKLKFKQLKLDPCVYYNENFIIGIYVDDLLLAAKSNDLIIEFKGKFKKIYDITDNNEVNTFLGTKVINYDDDTIIIQDTYTERMLTKFNYNNIKPKITPMESNLLISKSKEKINYLLQKEFQEKVGSLLYLMVHSRPDICYAVSKMTQFCSNPTIQHMNFVKRIYAYLNKTIHLGVKIDKNKDFQLNVFVDASFAQDPDERKSTSGLIIFLDNTPIYWRSKKQSLVAKSTMEAELIALETAVTEIIWIKNLLEELNFKQQCIPIYCDNIAAIEFATQQNINSRNKHIDIRKCFVKDHIKKNTIKLIYVSTEDNIADIFTKSLSKVKFNKFVGKMNMINIKKECWT